jgi:hypothetical protein
MKRFLHKIEVLADKIIPYLLILLLIIILLDIFYPVSLDPYRFEIDVIDYIIIAFFAVDLIFKYVRLRNPKEFLKKYWIEIIATLPFFLVARIIEEFAGFFVASEDIARGQRLVHEGLAVEEKIAVDLGRSERFVRIVRPVARFPRFAKAMHFFQNPKKRRHKI